MSFPSQSLFGPYGVNPFDHFRHRHLQLFLLTLLKQLHDNLFQAGRYGQASSNFNLIWTGDHHPELSPPPSPPVLEIRDFTKPAMAGLAHNQLYSNESQTPLHWHKRLCEGEDDLVLDDHILDSHTYDMAAAEHVQRRESFASSASLVSPTQLAWPEFAYNPEPASTYPMSNTTTSLFPEHGPSHFPHPDAPQFAHCGNHMAPWQQQANPGPDLTTAAFNTFASDLETIKPEAPYNGDIVPPQHGSNVYGGLPVQMDSEYSQYPTSAASPQWSTSSSDAVEKIPGSGHFQSPIFNHNPPHLRRDGVRKKNARFDIPEGRNLQTIDELINSTNPSNEDEIKELKQQKRLLRNRQAAYVHHSVAPAT